MEQIASKLLHFIFGVAELILTCVGDGGTGSPAGRDRLQGEERSRVEVTGRGQAIAPTMDEVLM